MQSPFHVFAGPYLDRRAELRNADDWLAAARADRETRYVVAAGLAQLVTDTPVPDVVLLPGEHALVAEAHAASLTLLGWFRGSRCVLVEVSTAAISASITALPAGAQLSELRPIAANLPADSAGLLAYARALGYWRERHRFCGVCGSLTTPMSAGHVLRCTNDSCAATFFPRIDPAIIVLVTDASGERALLGRQASWPAGRYSTIAGFVEPGESLEDAVAREVQEETGVRVASVRYHSSQPWPFPSSLMLGFHATAATLDIAHSDGELEDARWFARADVAAGHPKIPPSVSISYRLIEAWFDAGCETPLAAQTRIGRWDAPR
jgi:NAD+ diphosphatase